MKPWWIYLPRWAFALYWVTKFSPYVAKLVFVWGWNANSIDGFDSFADVLENHYPREGRQSRSMIARYEGRLIETTDTPPLDS